MSIKVNLIFYVCMRHTAKGFHSQKLSPNNYLQISSKFRAEAHPQHGLLRGREFLMKDLYTFDCDHASATRTYEQVRECYEKIFLRRLHLPVVSLRADPGLIGGDLSHEFHLAAEVGEDKIAVNDATGHVTSDVDDVGDGYQVKNTIELGHAFLLGDVYSKRLHVKFMGENGKAGTCQMGCYGVGVTRVVAAALETMSTEGGLRWPKAIAPYKVCVVTAREGSKSFERSCLVGDRLYDEIDGEKGLKGDVLLDDRHRDTIGWRLKQAKLIGHPLVVVVGNDVVEGKVEVIDQNDGGSALLHVDQVASYVRDYFQDSQSCSP